MKTDDPGKYYDEFIEKQKTLRNAPKIEDLPSEMQSWLRAGS